MRGLRYVVVKGEDGAGEVEGRVECVGEVGGEVVCGWRGGDGDAGVFGESSWVELFLLGGISGERFGDLGEWGKLLRGGLRRIGRCSRCNRN